MQKSELEVKGIFWRVSSFAYPLLTYLQATALGEYYNVGIKLKELTDSY